MENVLVALVGLSPAVVTETIWALAHQTPPVLVHRLILVTTAAGRELARSKLTGQGAACRGKLHELLDTLAKDGVVLDAGLAREGDRLVIRTPDEGAVSEVDDGFGEDDVGRFGDLLVSVVDEIVRDEGTCLHLSLSGGRKSMSHIGGTVMSLLARRGDRLLHVRVFPERLERADFFFPTGESFLEEPTLNRLPGLFREGRENREISPDDILVELTDVPFVRLGCFKPIQKALAASKRHGLSHLVAVAQRYDDPEAAFWIDFRLQEGRVLLGDRDVQGFPTIRGPNRLALLALLGGRREWKRQMSDDDALLFLRTWREMEKLLPRRGALAEPDAEARDLWKHAASLFAPAVQPAGSEDLLWDAELASDDLFFLKFNRVSPRPQDLALRPTDAEARIHDAIKARRIRDIVNSISALNSALSVAFEWPGSSARRPGLTAWMTDSGSAACRRLWRHEPPA